MDEKTSKNKSKQTGKTSAAAKVAKTPKPRKAYKPPVREKVLVSITEVQPGSGEVTGTLGHDSPAAFVLHFEHAGVNGMPAQSLAIPLSAGEAAPWLAAMPPTNRTLGLRLLRKSSPTARTRKATRKHRGNNAFLQTVAATLARPLYVEAARVYNADGYNAAKEFVAKYTAVEMPAEDAPVVDLEGEGPTDQAR